MKSQRLKTGVKIINGIRFQTIAELTRIIREDEDADNHILDPSQCERPTFPYSTVCLITHRFVLLQPCYQIDNLFKDRPDLYGRTEVHHEDETELNEV